MFVRLMFGPGLFAAAAFMIAFAGCVNPPPPSDANPSAALPLPASQAPDRPEVVTDLSTLSKADTYAPPAAIMLRATPAPKSPGASRNQDAAGRIAASAPETAYQQGASSVPAGAKGQSRLLNTKAQKYAEFSYVLLNRTLKAAELDAPGRLSQRRVPDDLKTTVLTAVMDSQGRLNEIIINQHSGDLAVDKLFIEACKKGIWSRNPPLGAQDSDGNYRVQVQGTIFNVSFDRYGAYSYETDIGIGLL